MGVRRDQLSPGTRVLVRQEGEVKPEHWQPSELGEDYVVCEVGGWTADVHVDDVLEVLP